MLRASAFSFQRHARLHPSPASTSGKCHPPLGPTARHFHLPRASFRRFWDGLLLTEEVSGSEAYGEEKLLAMPDPSNRNVLGRFRHTAAVQILHGLRLLGLAVQVARKVVLEWRRLLIRQEQRARLEAEELRTEKLLEEELARQRLLHAQSTARTADPTFFSMLKLMDNPAIALEKKWDELRKHTSRKADLRQPLLQLFKVAGESSKAAQETTAAEAGALWKSAHTQAVIKQEEVFKQQVFLQMLQSS